MKVFLGVDGGQSGTTAVIGDDSGKVLGTGEAGPCNHAAAEEGRAKLERAVRESVGTACAAAGLDSAAVRFEAACFGMSGGPDDKREILEKIVRAGCWIVTTDAVTALAGATAGGRGIIAIAGTGSIAFGRNPEGRSARAGGWGYVFGDEGGAFDIARQALRAALRMEEGWGPPTALRAALLEAAGCRSANEVLHRFYGPEWPRSRVATLAPLVDQAAAAGDGAAAAIVNRAAQELALLVAAVRSQLWRPGEAVDVAHIGGVFKSRTVLERFRMLVEMEEGNRPVEPRYGPAEGALLEALREGGVRVEALRRS
jgi:N-acetylglucosamine kinase-like BadF-type ATPase